MNKKRKKIHKMKLDLEALESREKFNFSTKVTKRYIYIYIYI